MVSSWYSDGLVSSYDAASANMGGLIHLATDGAVNANAVTRLQYPTPIAIFGNGMLTSAPIRIDRATYDAVHAADATARISVFVYVAPANRVPAAPTISDIVGTAKSSGIVIKCPVDSPVPPVGGSVDTNFLITGPSPSQLTPNTKYWLVAIPMWYKPSNPVGTASILPGAVLPHGLGRGISFWSNRTPVAPVIVSPTTNSVVASGTLLDLAITPADPDAMFGGTSPQYTDVAGTHVQYAAVPSPTNPNPTWFDLPFATDDAVVVNKGWWIKGASANVDGDGASGLALNETVKVKCGSNTPVASAGLLPSGAWQIRVRTFDFGHPFPTTYDPLYGLISGGAYSPSNYPAVNTSPWSTPVILIISAQVPAPTPLFPVSSIAVPESTPVSLSWQYRNTAIPPFAQAKRSVRIRKSGDTAWTDLAMEQVSGSATLLVAGFPLVSGNQYEWQVQVRDTDGVLSAWSDIVRFWVVPLPSSGSERPDPTGTIDGATLGCGDNRVFIYRRGGQVQVAELTGVSYVEWNRLRDDISTAEIRISGWDEDCGSLLSKLEPWAYEVVIIRDNGFSQDRVWEGPITLITYEQDMVTIDAKDVMVYAYRRIIRQQMNDTRYGDTVVSRASRVIQNAFAPDDPNVLSYLTLLIREDDAKQYRSTPAFSRTAYEEVDDMAANAGLDYTVFGRAIMLWGTKHRIGTLPEFQNKNLGSPPIVSVYGMSTANVYVVSDGNGVYGEATRLDEFGHDETYGLIEMLSSSWASDSEPEDGTYTQAGLDKIRASFAESAERSIASRYPPPVVVRVPDNTTINADTVISIQHLLPGVVIPLRSTGTIRTVVASQKLDSVKVVQQGGSETISITMSPFSRDDVDIDEEGE